jgi:iron-sulfur cluster repair protein YtfE (RIC family)
MTTTHTSIDPSVTLRELVAARPATRAVLVEYGMDACCGGDLTVERAAKAHGVDLAVLLEKLLKAES